MNIVLSIMPICIVRLHFFRFVWFPVCLCVSVSVFAYISVCFLPNSVSASCRSVLELPDILSSSDVSYSLINIHFYPSYFELHDKFCGELRCTFTPLLLSCGDDRCLGHRIQDLGCWA